MKVGDTVRVTVTPFQTGEVTTILDTGLVVIEVAPGQNYGFHKTWLEVINGEEAKKGKKAKSTKNKKS